MCGIAGIFSYREEAPPVGRDELLRMREAMVFRGPDGAGLWISGDARVGLAHRRLAIIDLSDNGLQPMASEDGGLQIVFNGEIYNYRELRRELESRGRVFRTDSDTEVLLHLYAERGADMVHALRGMFAFGIWDGHKREMFLARDPLGIKPLYYADDGGTLRFSTLVHALVEGGGIDTAEDVAGVGGFYLWGCVPEPHTFYRAVRALPAGHTLRVSRGASDAPRAYFSVATIFRQAEDAPLTLPDAEMHERIGAVMRESMRYHMVADVPVSLFLSAGVDSNVLASLGAALGPERLHGITLGFDEYRGTADDETVMAGAAAKGLGIGHQTQWLRRADFADQRPGFSRAMDQASTDGINSYLVARAARQSGFKLAISGLGGDELFGGYPSFRDVPRMRRLIPRAPFLGRALRGLAAPLLGSFTSPKYASLLEYGATYTGAYLLRRTLYLPWELPGLLGHERAAHALEQLRPLAALEASVEGLRNERCIVAALELSWYMRNQLLRDADWAGMYHGVEIRVPFVDAEVLRALAPMVAGANPPSKTHLVKAIAHPLTRDLLQRRKTGFSVPVADWLRAEFPALRHERGLRGWARVIGRIKGGTRHLALLTDAYGGHGGIALHNRDLLQSICDMPDCAKVVALPRVMPNPPEVMPPKLDYVMAAIGGKMRYLAQTARLLCRDHAFDLIVCGHINLVPLAYLIGRWLDRPVVLFIHGIDAWQPTRSALVNHLVRKIPWVVAVSELTAGRFRGWVRAPEQKVLVNPNGIHLDWYGPGPKDEALLDRYGLRNRRVLMTLGRLVSVERYKGFDEVIDIMPRMLRYAPDLAYLIAGDGSDRGRLQAKVDAMGLASHVVFAGPVAEREKAAHYRLADVFVMASRGEGFGFVLLEALACGIPVIASKLDGGREAIREGELGSLIDPGNADELEQALVEALAKPREQVLPGLAYFASGNFARRTQALIRTIVSR
jgi:asparagine synthase (glutamine-hydrolysing)